MDNEFNVPLMQDWLLKLPTIKQAVVMQAIRMCDTSTDEDSFRFVIRHYRAAVVNGGKIGRALCAGEEGDRYMTAEMFGIDTRSIVRNMNGVHLLGPSAVASFSVMPEHFRAHFIDGVEIIMKNHPSMKVRKFFSVVMGQIVSYMERVESVRSTPTNNRDLSITDYLELAGFTPKRVTAFIAGTQSVVTLALTSVLLFLACRYTYLIYFS